MKWLSTVLPDNVKGKQLLYRGTTPLSERYVGNAFIFKDIIVNSGADEYIDKKEALRMLDAHREGTEDNYRKLWVILVFLKWHSLFVGN